MVDAHEAQQLAQVLLAAELPCRYRHSAGVMSQAGWLAATAGPDRWLLVAAAWLHDIGYSSSRADTGFHPVDGARHLRGPGADERLVDLVAHHWCARIEAALRGVDGLLHDEFRRDPSLPHDELCFCDQTTGPDGDPMDVTERLAEIRSRYEDGSTEVRLGAPLSEVVDALTHGRVHLQSIERGEVVMLRPRALNRSATGWGSIEVVEADIDWDESGEPKTDHRTVPIPPRPVELLRSWIDVHELAPDDLLFRTRNDRGPAPDRPRCQRDRHRNVGGFKGSARQPCPGTAHKPTVAVRPRLILDRGGSTRCAQEARRASPMVS